MNEHECSVQLFTAKNEKLLLKPSSRYMYCVHTTKYQECDACVLCVSHFPSSICAQHTHLIVSADLFIACTEVKLTMI